MKKMFLLLSIVIVFICAGCSSIAEVEPTQPNITETLSATVPETIPVTEPQAISTTKGAIQMTDEEKKEKFDTIKSRNNIGFPLSTEILEIEIKTSTIEHHNFTTDYYNIDAIFRVNEQDMKSIYAQIDKQNEEELYQWDKWLKNEKPYFREKWLYLVEDREDYVFFDKGTPDSGKGVNMAYFLILPDESSDSYIIYFCYFGE